jgi:hypothetical protein
LLVTYVVWLDAGQVRLVEAVGALDDEVEELGNGTLDSVDEAAEICVALVELDNSDVEDKAS